MNEISVIRRDGSSTPLNINKIRDVVGWACQNLSVNPIALEAGLTTRLKEGISTKEIQDNLISCALEMCSPSEPDWRYVAGRLHLWGYTKDVKVHRELGGYRDRRFEDVSKTNFGQYVQQRIEDGSYDPRLSAYSPDELQEAGSWINPSLDLDYDYAGAVLLTSRYLLPNELPQEAFLVCALLLALPEETYNRLRWAKTFYEAIAKRKISLATPILANLRVPNGNLASCFITVMDDSLESIFHEITNAAKISKNGGGVGVNLSRVRSTGSWVMGKRNASGGVIPWIKLLNDTAIAVNQGGKRAGAITVGIDVWHLDVPEFLEMQTENGDQRRKAYDCFPQLIIPDEFMRRAIAKQEWTLVDPYEVRTKLGIELAELWGEEFERAYKIIEAEAGNKITLYQRINARELFKTIMRSQLETGMPYLAFKDTINEANPGKNEGMISQVNLCVAPETKVLTKRGYQTIVSLAGQYVDIWNGSEFSTVLIRKTGENQKLIRVKLSNNTHIDCTPYHSFYVADIGRTSGVYRATTPIRKVQASDLREGDTLIKFDLPVIDGQKEMDYAYTHGFFCGDGHKDKELSFITLCDSKQELIPHFAIANKTSGRYRKDEGSPSICANRDGRKTKIRIPSGIAHKFFVPVEDYSLQSKLDWLAGLLDADGTVSLSETGLSSFTIGSVNLDFLQDVRLMLQTLGVDTKIVFASARKQHTIKGAPCSVQDFYHISISANAVFHLSKIGLKTNRLKWEIQEPTKKCSKYIKVVSVEDNGRIDDSYCFSEPKRHLGMFNGILTGQCTESFSNVKPNELSHVCNLVSLNLANLQDSEMPEACQTAVRLLDNTIELTSPPIAESENHNNRYRTIGVGAMGLADWLAKRHLTYENLGKISGLFEEIGYHCTHASMELAKERSPYPAFSGSEWSKGLLIGSKPVSWFQENAQDKPRWQELSENIQRYGIRNSHITAIAPNTSSALVQGCTASILPVYGRFFYDKGSKGAVPIAPPFINDCFWFYPENKNLNQAIVVKATSIIQQWIDTGISMELLFNLNQGVYFPDDPERALTAKDIFQTLVLAWETGCKAIYYVRTVQKDNFKDTESTCTSCAN